MTINNRKGLFLTFEGPDGSGKSTAAKYLVDKLKSKDFDVYYTREPGGTLVAEKIRDIILSKKIDEEISPMTELLLFAAARAQHIEKVIKPKMDQGTIVVSDRFSDSSFAYQGLGRGFIREVLALEDMVHQGFEPDYTLFFDVTLEESIRRISLRPEASNRLDDEGIIFKSKVYEGYTIRFEQNQHRMYKIDAMQDISGVQDQIDQWINKTLIQRRVNKK